MHLDNISDEFDGKGHELFPYPYPDVYSVRTLCFLHKSFHILQRHSNMVIYDVKMEMYLAKIKAVGSSIASLLPSIKSQKL